MNAVRCLIALAAILSISVSCATNRPYAASRLELTGHGVDGQLVVHGRRVNGEVLEVSDTAFVVKTSNGILLVPKFAIDEAFFSGLDLYRGADLVGDVLEQHRLLSRFPLGMSATVLRSLLQQAGQSELQTIPY